MTLMKQILTSILLLFFISTTHAQKPSKLDSLKNVLAHLPAEGKSFASDTLRVRVLCEMVSYEYDFKKASEILKKADKIVDCYDWREGKAWLLSYEGMILFRENFIYQSIDKLLEALNIAENSQPNEKLLAFCHRQLGSAYFVLEEDKIAITHYSKASNIYKKNSSNVTAKNYSLMISNIGLCYMRMKNFDQAITNFKEAIRNSHIAKDSTALGWYYSNLGSAQRNAGDYKNSILNFNIALQYFGNKNIENQAFTLSEKSLSYLKLGDSKQALKLSNEAKAKAKNGKPYFNLYILQAAYLIEKDNHLLPSALSDYEKYDSLKNINDQILKQKSIEGLKFSFENQKNEITLEKEKFKNTSLLIGLLVLGIFSIFIIFNQRLLRKKNLEIDTQKQEIEGINKKLENFNKELEVKVEERTKELQKAYNEIKEAVTKGQTIERKRVASELHDNLGSMISGIRYQMQAIDSKGLVAKEQKIYQRIYELIGDAYNEVRNISHNLIPSALENEGIYTALNNLINDLNSNGNIRFKLITDLTCKFSKEVEIELYSALLEIINNILKHSSAKNVQIDFKNQQNGLLVQVTDDGLGFDIKSIGNGKGLENIDARIAKIGGGIIFETFQNTGNMIQISL
jgi:signal transduction histidine kinase/tetratricopeptide (TPR) repeat protein